MEKFKLFILKIYIKIHERNYCSKSNIKITYMMRKKSFSKNIIICFSGYTGNDLPSRYNYITTLIKSKNNVLWIKDNYGYNNTGGYYILDKNKRLIYDDMKEFIDFITRKYTNKYYVGSSKGGTAALIYGIALGGQACVVGAPQYYITDYLQNNNCNHLLYNLTEDDDEWNLLLNYYLENIIKCNKNKTLIYLHYSKKEHTYLSHIKKLIFDLKSNNYLIFEDISFYKKHEEVGKYFKDYLKKILIDLKKRM